MSEIEIQHGAEVELKFNPDSGWHYSKSRSDIGQNPWTMNGDKQVNIVFVKDYPNYPGIPYGIPEAWWNNVLQSKIRDFLKHPETGPFNQVVFGFKGWFNDNGLTIPSGSSKRTEYASQVASLVNKDAEYYTTSSCLIEVHFSGPGGFGSNTSYSDLMDKIEDWGSHGQESLDIQVEGQGSVGVYVNGNKAKTF